MTMTVRGIRSRWIPPSWPPSPCPLTPPILKITQPRIHELPCHLSWDADIFILAWIGFYNELKMGTDSLALPPIDYPALESGMLLMTCLTNKVVVLVTQSCPTLCDPMDCGPPGFSVHGILQARILEWVAIPFSRGSFRSRVWTRVSCIAGRFFTIRSTGKIQ